MNASIIGLCGLKGSGKNTVGSILEEDFGYLSDSFAKPLKDTVSTVFGWDRELIDGTCVASRNWRESKDEYWSEILGKDVTPRFILQHLGTEIFRNCFHENIWVSSMEKRIQDNLKNNKKMVITDLRFENEFDLIKKYNGKNILVTRGKTPEWKDDAINAN